MLKDWFKALWNDTSLGQPRKMESSLERWILSDAINRRRNTRIRYPNHRVIDPLPRVYVEGEPFLARDISLGGICLVDSKSLLKEQIGRRYLLTLSWKGYETEQEAVMVGVNLSHRHMRFHNLDPEALVRLSHLLRPGYIGTHFHRVLQDTNSPLQLGVNEMWMGPTGETILFYPEEKSEQMLGALGEVRMDQIGALFYDEPSFVYKDQGNGHMKGQRVAIGYLQNLMVCLSNIKTPTPNIHRLLDLLESLLEEKSKGRSLHESA